MIYEFQAQLFDTEAEMLLHIAHAYVCGGDDWDNEVSSEYLNDMTDREIAEEIFNDWYKEDADGGLI